MRATDRVIRENPYRSIAIAIGYWASDRLFIQTEIKMNFQALTGGWDSLRRTFGTGVSRL